MVFHTSESELLFVQGVLRSNKTNHFVKVWGKAINFYIRLHIRNLRTKDMNYLFGSRWIVGNVNASVVFFVVVVEMKNEDREKVSTGQVLKSTTNKDVYSIYLLKMQKNFEAWKCK